MSYARKIHSREEDCLVSHQITHHVQTGGEAASIKFQNCFQRSAALKIMMQSADTIRLPTQLPTRIQCVQMQHGTPQLNLKSPP